MVYSLFCVGTTLNIGVSAFEAGTIPAPRRIV